MGELEDLKPQLCSTFSRVEDFYDITDNIAEGHYSKVVYAISKSNGTSVAVKITPKRKKGIVHAIREELSVLKELVHSNILKILEVLESEFEVYIISELLSGGSLFDRVMQGRVPYEEKARNIFRQALCALEFIHSHKIIHRDLKPQNLIFLDDRDNSPIKLIDFGGSIRIKKDMEIDKQVGTVKYMAPEMIGKKEYDTQVDMWSMGVLLYFTLSGTEPFNGHGGQLYSVIREGQYSLPSPQWDPVSASARNLLSRMLVKDPTKRITAKESLQHPWIQLDKDRFGRWSLPDLSAEKLEHPELYVKKFIAKRALIGACQAVILVNYFLRLQRTLIQQNKPPKIKLLNSTNTNSSTQNQQRLTCIAPGRVSRSPMRGAGQMCTACNRPVDIVEAVQVSLGIFHYSCFVCGACGGALRGSFAEVNGSPYHTECLPAPTTNDSDLCYVCGKSCYSGIKALSRTYHEKCFKCYICSALITEEVNYEEEGGEPYHRSCLQKRKAQEPWRRPTSKSGGRPTSQRNSYNTPSPSNFEYSAAAASMKGYQPGMQPNYRPTPLSEPPPNTSFDRTSVPVSPSGSNMSSRRVSFEGDLQSTATNSNYDQSKFKSKFCQECGSRYTNNNARFCMECGAARA